MYNLSWTCTETSEIEGAGPWISINLTFHDEKYQLFVLNLTYDEEPMFKLVVN